MTWMQHHQQKKLQITTSAITDLCCLVRLHIIQKKTVCLRRRRHMTWDFALFFLLISSTSEREKHWLIHFRNFFVLGVVFSFTWGTLSDSSWTGILDARHSKLSLFLWGVAPSLASPLGVLQAASLARGDQSFYSVVKLHLTSWIFHLQTDFKVYPPAS